MMRDIEWKKWRDQIMKNDGSYHPLEEALYKAWCAAWDSAVHCYEDAKPNLRLGQRGIIKLAMDAGLVERSEIGGHYVCGEVEEVVDFARLIEDAHAI